MKQRIERPPAGSEFDGWRRYVFTIKRGSYAVVATRDELADPIARHKIACMLRATREDLRAIEARSKTPNV